MRSFFLPRWLLLTLLGGLMLACEPLGLGSGEPQELRAQYTDEHSRFIDIDGVGVHARVQGEGETVLLLHGVLASLHTWDAWVQELAADYHVVRIDVPPFGLSGAMRGYGPERMSGLIEGVLDHYGVDTAVLVGNSLGGYYAAYYAAHHPQRVRALALVSPAAYPQQMPLSLRLGATPGLGKVFEWFAPRWVVRYGLRRMYGEPARLDEATAQRYFDLIRAPGNRAQAREVLREMLARRDEQPRWVRRISQPTLLLWGEQDAYTPVELAGRWLDDLQEAHLVVYPDAGHVAMEELPGRSVRDLRRFLDQLD